MPSTSTPSLTITPAADRPVPREPKSDEHRAQIVVQNRRCEYLERNPSYYNNVEHELAGNHASPGCVWHTIKSVL